MDRMIYVAMSAAREAQRAQTITSHNIANIATNGFRAIHSALDSAPEFSNIRFPSATVRDEATGRERFDLSMRHTAVQPEAGQ